MKKLLLISILIFLAKFSIVAQSACPSISIIAPKELVKIGDSMTFTAKIDGINSENLKYQWTITNGAISSGQGTLSINVVTLPDMAGMTITAMLEVSGLPQNCSNEFNNSGEIEAQRVIGCGFPRLEEYGKISWLNEKLRLDEVAKILREDKELFVFFQIKIKQKNYSELLKARKTKFEKYLIEQHRISKDRIKFYFAGNDENLMRVWFIPKEVMLPN